MKYLALALALLLAVGSHAAPVPDDLSNKYSQFTTHAKEAIANLKSFIIEALADVQDESERSQLKQQIGGVFEKVDNAVLLIDGAVSTAIESTADIRAAIKADIAELTTETASDVTELEKTLEKHQNEYNKFIEDLRQNPDLVNFKEKFDSTLISLKSKFDVNVQETQTVLKPITDEIRNLLVKWAERIQSRVSS